MYKTASQIADLVLIKCAVLGAGLAPQVAEQVSDPEELKRRMGTFGQGMGIAPRLTD